MNVGDVYLIANPQPNKKHYHFVVSEIKEDNTLVLVFMSTIKPDMEYDDSCILHPDEMNFIRSDSYIVYERILVIKKDYLQDKIDIGTVRYKGTAPDHIMDRIRYGALKSKRIRPSTIKYFKEQI